MTEDEFKDKTLELLKEFIDSNDDKQYFIFVYIESIESGDVIHFGFGCPACAAEHIADDLILGAFEHVGNQKVH